MGLGGAIGFALGAVRAAVCLMGLLLGALLAIPLGTMLKPLIPMVGLTHPVWSWTLPPVVFLLLVFLVCLGVSFAVHRPVELYYKFKADEYHRRAWHRLNQRLGIVPGILGGVIALLALGVFAYVVGYGTLTFSADEGEPTSIRLVNSLRSDMPSAGLDKIAAVLDPAPRKYYDAIDLMGFAYRNLPKARDRLANYPPLYAMGERPDIQEFLGDKEFQDMLNRKTPLGEMINHPRALALLGNTDLLQILQGLDLKDLHSYLESGKSAKYDPYQILGRWNLDVEQAIFEVKKAKPEIKAAEMALIRNVMSTLLANTHLKAFPDNRLVFTFQGIIGDVELMKKAAAAMAPKPPPPPVDENAEAQADSTRGMSSMDRRRYGLGGGPPRAAQPPPEAAPPIRIEPKTIQGTWEGEGDSYLVKLPDDKGASQEGSARIQGDELVISYLGQKLVFVKQ
jgi:hypothetical protein